MKQNKKKLRLVTVPYLVTVTVIDGEHESTHRAIYHATTPKKVWDWVDSQCGQGLAGLDKKDGYFGYGDELTRTKPLSVEEISKKTEQLLYDLDVAYRVNRWNT